MGWLRIHSPSVPDSRDTEHKRAFGCESDPHSCRGELGPEPTRVEAEPEPWVVRAVPLHHPPKHSAGPGAQGGPISLSAGPGWALGMMITSGGKGRQMGGQWRGSKVRKGRS